MARARTRRSKPRDDTVQGEVDPVPVTIEGETSITFVAGPPRVSGKAVLDELHALGVDVEGVTADDITKLRRAGGSVLDWMTFGHGDVETFARDPAKALQEAAPEVAAAIPDRPSLDLVEAGVDVRVRYAEFDAAAATLVTSVIEWAGQSSANAAKLARDPAGAVAEVGASASATLTSAVVSAFVQATSPPAEAGEEIPVLPPGAEVPRLGSGQEAARSSARSPRTTSRSRTRRR